MPGKPENQTSYDEPDGSSDVDTASVTTLANLLTPERVLCNVTARSKKHCLEIVARLLTNDQDSLTEAEVFDTIYQREKLGGTGLGEGFALPHGRVEELEHSVGAFLMLTQPIDFDLEGDEGVDMIFAMAVPENSDEQHLKDLSAIAQLLANTDVRGKVSHLVSSTDIHQALIELSASIED
ncbi:MAG: PTS sugar transporter subunit IIA [Gammaproteobacteria bacterium]